MRRPRLLTAGLWTLNALVGAAILVFAIRLVTGGHRAPDLPGADGEATASPGPGNRPVKTDGLQGVPNPVTPGSDPSRRPPAFPARYLGRFGIQGQETAMLMVPEKQMHVNAYAGEAIAVNGVAVEELRGWLLVLAGEDRAVFKNGDRTVEVLLEEAGTKDR